MANTLSNWQDAINSQLLGRLVLPLTQAGVTKRDMSQKIINRSDRFLNRLPLLSQQMQRWGNLNTLSSETVPIVYAQNYAQNNAQNIGSAVESSNRVDQLVSPQITSHNLSNSQSSEMPLRAKFANSAGLVEATSPISDRPSTKSISDSRGEFPEPQAFASEHPMVAPEAIAPASSTIGEMTLQAKFASSEGLVDATSQSPPSLTSPPLTTELNNPNTPDYPVVTPKNIVETFSVNQENRPLRENSAVTSEPLLIAQPKIPNPTSVSSDLPIVNRLNNLNKDKTSQSPSQSSAYLGDRHDIKSINSQIKSPINSQIFSTDSPIVTSAETRAIAANPLPNLELSQDYIGLAEKETKGKVVGKEEGDNTLSVYKEIAKKKN
ncbi:hypothetical protein [Pseudanabaena minima]|uniref:hypothetical protein n=1 Tax=Pseudanabaena minima TaxID=890415 RepID=UPI003DA7D080